MSGPDWGQADSGGGGLGLLDCPSREVLAEFELGRLSEGDFDAVADHLSSCEKCGAAIDELHVKGSNDVLVARLRECFRQPALVDVPDPSRLDELAATLSATVSTHLSPRGPLASETATGVDRRAPFEKAIGQLVGPYRIVSVIGVGGMGVVYRARHVKLGREAAVKMVLSGRHASPGALARFDREAAAVARARHPNVVEVYEFHEHDGLPYIAMELVDGGSLRDTLKGGPLPPREAARVARDLAEGLALAHSKGVIHRDLKPANVLMTTDGTPKITDFGLAKLLDSAAEEDQETAVMLTDSRAVLGTAAYMAPEQADGRSHEVGERTDVYALGVILYEMLTGRSPFRSNSKGDTIELVLKSAPTPPARGRPEVTAALESICLRCLEKSPAARYATARELADELDLWLASKRPRKGLTRRTRLVRSARRHALLVATLAAFVLGALAIFGYATRDRRAVAEIENALGRGLPVRLVGEMGPPAWSRPVIGEPDVSVRPGGDGTLKVSAVDLSLLELVPDSRSDRYRVSARVRHDASDVTGDVGIYAAHHVHDVGGIEAHQFLRVSFNSCYWQDAEFRKQNPMILHELPPTPALNAAELCGDIYAFYGGQPHYVMQAGFHAGPGFKVPEAKVPVWHDLKIDVTPEYVTGWWDGSPFSIPMWIVRRDLDRDVPFRPLHDMGPPRSVPTRVSLRGGVGLFVRHGSASFRSVKITPLGRGNP